jgi:hypothetical protein
VPDRFPEAFRRFEKVVYVERFKNYQQLAYAFSSWAGKRWRDTYKQNLALKREAYKIGFEGEIPAYYRRQYPSPIQKTTWKHETVLVKGRTQTRYRDLKTGRFIKKPS